MPREISPVQTDEELLDYRGRLDKTDIARIYRAICGGPRFNQTEYLFAQAIQRAALQAHLQREQALISLIADDNWAATFQSLAGYRTAVLHAIREHSAHEMAS